MLCLFFFSVDDTKAGIKMEIVFKRRLTNELLTTYLPTSLLLGITYATTFFKPFFFEAALTVNLTVMLVITTLFIRSVNHCLKTLLFLVGPIVGQNKCIYFVY